jgi:hypothetical protein
VQSRDPRSSPIVLAEGVTFLKEEVFVICAALALGESLLNHCGFECEALHLSGVFDAVEGRLA